mgnify:CR=1 FL=1
MSRGTTQSLLNLAMSEQDLPVFLHVGCGPKRQGQTPFAGKSWRELRLDIDASVQPDVVGTMTEMADVADGKTRAFAIPKSIHLPLHAPGVPNL